MTRARAKKKVKKTEDEKARARAEGVAKRYNNEQAAKAPLLAYAGLTPTRTADEVLDRKAEGKEATFWVGVERDIFDAQKRAVMDWHRWIVWSMVDTETYAAVVAWADCKVWVTNFVNGKPVPSLDDEGLIYWSYKWRQAAERVQRGESPLPESGRLQPKACWIDIQRAMSAGRWHPCHQTPQIHEPEPLADGWRAELERHAKCSPDFCRVSLRPRRAGRVIGSRL